MQLVEKGRIRLDDDIDASISMVVRNPAWPDVPITWRMLLTHTSSLDDEPDDLESSSDVYGRDPSKSLEEFVRETFSITGAHHRDGLFRAAKPGTERIYNSLAFALVGWAVQRVVGESFAQYVDRAILMPLGMSDPSYALAGRPTDRFGVGYASLQKKDRSFRYEPADAFWAHRDAKAPAMDHVFTCSDYPTGCMHTTAHDFALLMQMFQ